MKVIVNIETCRNCHHSDHSGAFTVGGAREICGHSDACKKRKSIEEFAEEYPEYVTGKKKDRFDFTHWKYHWYNRITDGEIPDWCPLKNGGKY